MRDKSGWLSWWVIATLVLSLLGGAVRPAQAAEIISDFSGSLHAPSGTPVIDGVVDAVYGTVIATDAPADSQGGAPVDLSNLWVTQDASYFYFAFEVNTDLSANNWGKYALYIDTTGDAAGATTDAWGRSVVVSDPHKPEYGIYTWVDNPPYNPAHTNLVHWTGSSWDWGNATTIDEGAIGSGATSIVEWKVAKSKLGNPSQMWVEVWSTGGGGSDNAQDTINYPAEDWTATDWGSPATLKVSTPVFVVDGAIDPFYGAALAQDGAGDGNGNANMDLRNLYIGEDASAFYIAFTVGADIAATNWGKYALYVDTTGDAAGATTDAWGRNVVVSNPHKPEYGIYTWVDNPPYDPMHTNLVHWTGSSWDWGNATVIDEGAIGAGSTSVIEWKVDKAKLGNPSQMWVEVWNTGGGGGDNAQDTINDPAEDWNATNWSSQATLMNSTAYPPIPSHASHDNDVWWAELGHNSRDSLYRTPGGPVQTNTPVTLRLRAASGDLTAAKVRVYNDRTNTQAILDLNLVADDGTYEWWQVTLPGSPLPTVYWYRFLAIDGTDTDYYEDDAARDGGWGQAFDETVDNSYQLTIYDPAFQTPDWVKNGIVYQVYPDRFRDGNPANNKPAGTFFYNEPGGTIVRSNTSNWNEPICDPRQPSGPCAGTYSRNFYGGDLAGLTNKLNYLHNLGVTVIYLNPIFESPSNHGYDTTDYMKINPTFGTQAEFDALIAAAHTLGMKVVLDGVFNHTSSDSIYFDRYSRWDAAGNPTTPGVNDGSGACESASSPYRSWYYFTDVTPGTGVCVGSDGTPNAATYESWWNYDSLPKLRANEAQVRNLVWAQSTASVGPYWMQSADGWRLDVGGDVDPGTINDPTNDYWEGFRNALHVVKPDAYIVGEEWGNASSWVLGNEWDAVMNYQFSSAVLSFWRDTEFVDNDHNAGSSAGKLTPLTPEQLDNRLKNLMERYPAESLYAMMNLFDSHDTSRVLFMLDENASQNNSSLYANPNYDWSDAITRLKGAVLLQMTLPGAPTIYYGDEVGLVGPMVFDGIKWEDDPYNRQPYPWLDETGTPFYAHLQNAGQQQALYDYYAVLTGARNAHPALRTGDFRTLLVDNSANVYAYGRKMADHTDAAVVIINRANTAQTVTVNLSGYLPVGETFQNVLTGNSYIVDGDAHLTVANVPARSGAVLVLTSAPLPAAPAAVTDLTVSGVTASSVALSWSAASGANGYYVYRSLLSGGGYQLLGATVGTTYTDTTVQAGVGYYYVVVAVDTTTWLQSGWSNEVWAVPAYVIGWAGLDSPATITHTIGITPTPYIYGQAYIAGVTSLPGQTPTLRAQLGYGPTGTAPSGWSTWVEAAFDSDVGNNDQFKARLLPEMLGVYDYVYRFTTNDGYSWYYAQLGGGFDGNNPANNPGVLTVIASADTTVPTAPVLSVSDWGASFIDLEWTASTDNVAVYAYDVYRSATSGGPWTKLARVYAPDLTYHDASVATGQTYYYVVKALDTSFNPSPLSNEVSHAAEPKLVAVTFEVTVPGFTPGTVFLTRTINPDGTVGGWSPNASPLNKISDTLWTRTFNILEGQQMEFKFARGSWDTVMKGADGNEELANLSLTVDYGTNGTQTFAYTVLNWRDPIVTAFSPADGATGVPVTTPVTVTWSQAMAANTSFSVTGPGGAVSGTFAYDAPSRTVTFTPDSPLAYSTTYTVLVTGAVDAGGDVQQVPVTWSFTTESALYGVLLTPPTASNSQAPGQSVTYTLTVQNTAAVTDTFDVSVSSVWTATPSVTQITLAGGATTTFTVTVVVPWGPPGASDVATVTVTSQSDASATDSSTLTTSTAALYALSVSPTADSGSAHPGRWVTYTLTVTNDGNGSDVFTIETSSAWVVLVNPVGPLTLASGASATVQVMVLVPGGTPAGTSDIQQVSFTSQGDADVTETVVLTTTALQPLLYLPTILR
ncbi:MAG: Ig-like domain-containing protein [Anaerolinea sp.]|nr:Ig-like domain-containing protein [Anaerolinea sp.]